MIRMTRAAILAMLLTTPASAQSGNNPPRELCLALTTAYLRDPGNVLGDEEHTDEFRSLLRDAGLTSIEELRQFSRQLGLVPELVEKLVGLDAAGRSGDPAFQKELSAFLRSSSPDKPGVVTRAVTLLQLNSELVGFLDRCVAAYSPGNLRVVVEPESYEDFQVAVLGASGVAPRLFRTRQESSGQGLFCNENHVVTRDPPRLILGCHKFAKTRVQVRFETSLGLTEAVILPGQPPRSDCAAGDRALLLLVPEGAVSVLLRGARESLLCPWRVRLSAAAHRRPRNEGALLPLPDGGGAARVRVQHQPAGLPHPGVLRVRRRRLEQALSQSRDPRPNSPFQTFARKGLTR